MQQRGLLRICRDFRSTTGRDLVLPWGGWPICPEHHTHPLDPRLDQIGVATWFCPRGPAVAPVGALTHIDDGPGA